MIPARVRVYVCGVYVCAVGTLHVGLRAHQYSFFIFVFVLFCCGVASVCVLFVRARLVRACARVRAICVLSWYVSRAC